MVRRSLFKNSIREIKQSFGRYLAILAIVALGVGFFSGLKVTKEAMLLTGEEYFRENSLFDFRLISTLGLYEKDVEALKKSGFVDMAEGTYSYDVLVEKEDNSSCVAKFHALSNDINKVILLDGRMPEKEDECLADSRWYSSEQIGEKILISDSNKEETLDAFKEKELTIVGLCKSSLYVNFERGNTTLGSGKLAGFVYVLPSEIESDYFTEIYLSTKASKEKIYSDAYNDEIDKESEVLEDKLKELAMDKYRELKSDGEEKIKEAEDKIADAKKEISENEDKIKDAEDEVSKGEKDLESSKKEISNAKKQLEELKAFLPPAMYESKLNELRDAEEALKDGEKEIEDAKEEIEESKVKIEDAKKEISEHEEELRDAKDELNDLEEPETYVLTRGTNIGYACFENDSDIVEGIGNVFPVFFFLVAALVCMTTMNRMVEEKRTEIGTMKALGYSEADIMGKYLFYAGSAAIVGAVGGFFAGSKLFPYVIWNAYGIMYTMKDIVFLINKPLAIISLIVAILCSMGATYVSLNKELRSNAADLIRPKPPKNGKRVIFEKMTFLWKRLSFTAKVSVRNVFRYQKRLWMMVLGVGGCYGLLITGFGIKDSIADVCDCQFENIQKYDITVTFKEDVSLDERLDFKEAMEDSGKYIYAETKTVDVAFNNQQKSATMVVFCNDEEGKSGKDYINFMDESDKEINLPNKDECIINSKMAKMLGIKLGDQVILRDPDLNEIKVRVTGIMKNYVYNWAYISEETFREQRKQSPDFNTAFVKSFEDDYEVGARIGKLDSVASVTLTDEMSVRIDSMMDSLNEVVLLVIFCAAALAFIVMYNLTNINITERLREIATLKVLGFYPLETAVYVFRENLILTFFGMFAGLFMGYGLHRYVMYNINVEVVTFDTKILPMSYLYGVALTVVFALLVDLVFFFKLERIKMAESLKSVE